MDIDDEALEKAKEAFTWSAYTPEYWSGLSDKARQGEVEYDWQKYKVCLTNAIAAYLSALEARGMVIVPREPTNEMLIDGSASLRNFYSEEGPYPRTKAVYRAMLASARKGGG